jgi:peptidoglycan hydrolase-like protein with peptidoglycan-binding domain
VASDGPGDRAGYVTALLVAGAIVVIGGGLLLAFSRLGRGGASDAGPALAGRATARVVRTTVATHDLVSGTLGYSSNPASLTAASGGIVESLPAAGATRRRGQVLYRISGQPSVLLYGRLPAWRTLVLGMSGPDVRELNQNLRALGYLHGRPPGTFTAGTERALRRLQQASGAEVTGIVALGDVVFAPGAIHVESVPVVVGQVVPAATVLLQVASAVRVVSVPLQASSEGEAHVGDPVEIQLPDNSSIAGVVSSISRVATSSSADSLSSGQGSQSAGSGDTSATINVTVRLRDAHATANLDQAPVQVSITTASDRDVLAVPVGALLAQADGGYAVQRVRQSGVTTVPVTPGRFSDSSDLVAIRAGSLRIGDQVVVPG